MPIDQYISIADRALASRRVLRLAMGTGVAIWVSQAGAWTLSYLAPILTLSLLALPLSRPKAKFFIVAAVALLASVYGSFLFLPLLLNQFLAGLVLLALALFHSFYFTARGGPAAVGTLLTIGMTLTVAVGSVSVDLLIDVAHGVTKATIVGVGLAWLSHIVLPDLAEQGASEPVPPAEKPAAFMARRKALRALAIVLPICVWFVFSPASASNAAVMIKVAAMGQESCSDKVKDAARSLLTSTLAGGIAAIAAWQVLAIWPSLTLYTLLIALAGLFFGARIFAGRGLHSNGSTWSYAFLTMIVVLAPAALDSQFGSAADSAFYGRLFMLLGAAIYGVFAVYVFDAFWPAPEKQKELAQAPDQALVV
jgi:hypothetical protein